MNSEEKIDRALADIVANHSKMESAYTWAMARGVEIDPPPTLAEIVDRAVSGLAAELGEVSGAPAERFVEFVGEMLRSRLAQAQGRLS